MGQEKSEGQANYQELLDENESLKNKVDNFRKALGEVPVEKEVLQEANNIKRKIKEKIELIKK